MKPMTLEEILRQLKKDGKAKSHVVFSIAKEFDFRYNLSEKFRQHYLEECTTKSQTILELNNKIKKLKKVFTFYFIFSTLVIIMLLTRL